MSFMGFLLHKQHTNDQFTDSRSPNLFVPARTNNGKNQEYHHITGPKRYNANPARPLFREFTSCERFDKLHRLCQNALELPIQLTGVDPHWSPRLAQKAYTTAALVISKVSLLGKKSSVPVLEKVVKSFCSRVQNMPKRFFGVISTIWGDQFLKKIVFSPPVLVSA